MKRIAISGIKGRKKDSFLLSLVVILSLLFTVLATVLYSSSETTKYQQRIQLFGSWEAAYLNKQEEDLDYIRKIKEIDKLGTSRIIGKSESFGLVGTINQDLVEMGNFKFHEGRMPETSNEIALELNQLSHLSEEIKLGDKILVNIEIVLLERDENQCWEEQDGMIYSALDQLGAKGGKAGQFRIGDDFYRKNVKKYKRHQQTSEDFAGTNVAIKTRYLVSDLVNDVNSPLHDKNKSEGEAYINYLKKRASIAKRTAYLTREMELTGIFQTYSEHWDLANNPVANAFISEEAGQKFLEEGLYLTRETNGRNYKPKTNIFMKLKTSYKDFHTRHGEELEGLRKNTYAYPETEGSTEAILTYGILAAIFLGTIFAVFQIYLTQMKRRTRKIALLKSIGATNLQVIGILFWEVLFLLILSLPISILGGLGIARIVIFSMNRYGKTLIDLYINYRLSLIALLAGIGAVFIGMTIPVIKAMKVPLTGTISKPPRRSRGKLKRIKTEYKNISIPIQTFSKISIRNMRYNKAKTLLTMGLYTITITVLLSSIFLSFLSFGEYVDQVVVTGKPDYGLELDYGLPKRLISDHLEELRSIKGVEDIELYKSGEHAFLWYEGLEDNMVNRAFEKTLPLYLFKYHYGYNDTVYVNLPEEDRHHIFSAMAVNLYGIDTDSQLFNRFKGSISLGNINKESFREGREAVVLMPLYGEKSTPLEEITRVREREILTGTNKKNRKKIFLAYSDSLDISYDFRHEGEYKKDRSLRPGDLIQLTVPTEDIGGGLGVQGIISEQIRVSSIIHFFPGEGIWPFAESMENPVIIGSYDLIEKLYPATRIGIGSLSIENLRDLIVSLTPTRYGKTLIYLKTDKKIEEMGIDIQLRKFALNGDYKLYNYKQSKDQVFSKAFTLAAVITILGLAIAAITLIILFNTTLSKVEQERERIGTFQALGVSVGQFKSVYLITGLGYGVIGLVLGHLLMGAGLLITSFVSQSAHPLWLYPWKLHIAICISFLIITVISYYLPIKTVLKNQPVDNIRSLVR